MSYTVFKYVKVMISLVLNIDMQGFSKKSVVKKYLNYSIRN